MTTSPDTTATAALLRDALSEKKEIVMTSIDTDRELARFQDSMRRRAHRQRVLAAAASVAVLALAGGAFLLTRDGGGATTGPAGPGGQGMTGLMVLDGQTGRNVESQISDLGEIREYVQAGPITISTADVERAGTARLEGSASYISRGGTVAVSHTWGTMQAELDGTTCRGSFSWHWFADPQEAGGALQLACEDGAVLGASMVVESYERSVQNERGTFTVRLEDGFYVVG